MDLKILFLIFIIKTNIPLILTACDLNVEKRGNNPIYIQKFGTEEFVLNLNELPSTNIFQEGTELEAYCPSGLTNLNGMHYGLLENLELNQKKIDIICVNGAFRILVSSVITTYNRDYNNNNYYTYDGQLYCNEDTALELYEIAANETNSLICQEKLYYLALNFQKNPVYFGEVCFDLSKGKLEYVHFITPSIQLPIMSTYVKRAPVGFTSNNLKYKVQTPPGIFMNEEVIDKNIQYITWDQIPYELFKYRYADFLPSYITEPFFSYNSGDKNKLTQFLGWQNLINGNWKKFNEALELRSEYDTFDVYMGTYDVVEAITEQGLQKSLRIKSGRQATSIPKYIWSFLKSRNSTENFVVFGVNSPYIQHNEKLECEDMCDKIEWFGEFNKLRKYHIFGYMFCCETKAAMKFLNEIQIIQSELLPVENSSNL